MFNRRIAGWWVVCCALLALGAVPRREAAAHTTPTQKPAQDMGTVITYDTGSMVLTVNTRVGPKLFLLTMTTTILLNNHTATTADIVPLAQVTVFYNLQTSRVITVHLFRELHQKGTITAASGTSLNLKISGGATLTLTSNSISVVRVGGVPANPLTLGPLAGQKATVVYEPPATGSTSTTLLILSMTVNAPTLTGFVTAIDQTTRTLTVQLTRKQNGQATVNLTADAAVSVRKDEMFTTLGSVVVGDRVTIAYAGGKTQRRALAIDVLSSSPVPVASPSLLTARAVSANQVTLTWKDNSADEAGFRVERQGPSDAAFREITPPAPAATAAGTTVTYSDMTVAGGRTYKYRVRAFRTTNGAIQFSGYTPTVTVTTPPVP